MFCSRYVSAGLQDRLVFIETFYATRLKSVPVLGKTGL